MVLKGINSSAFPTNQLRDILKTQSKSKFIKFFPTHKQELRKELESRDSTEGFLRMEKNLEPRIAEIRISGFFSPEKN